MGVKLIAQIYSLMKDVDENEKLIRDAKEKLKGLYDDLVSICPHSEAVDRKSNIRGVGITRRCKICGITDYASEGGTPGDEYNYGYPGYPSRTFWSNAEVEKVSDGEFDSYRRSHDWVVTDGRAKKRFS